MKPVNRSLLDGIEFPALLSLICLNIAVILSGCSYCMYIALSFSCCLPSGLFSDVCGLLSAVAAASSRLGSKRHCRGESEAVELHSDVDPIVSAVGMR